jgi:hypothetical protein
MPTNSEPITLEYLLKMKAEFDAKFPEPLKFKNGADMSPETFAALGIPMVTKDDAKPWLDPYLHHRITGIDIHIVPGLEFGDVQECRCQERADYIKSLKETPPEQTHTDR